MINIRQFRENAEKDGLCDKYAKSWDACGSKKQLMDFCLRTPCIDYLCDSIAKGWGVSPQYIYENFRTFINGNYVSSHNGYESEMFCRYKGAVLARTPIISVIESDISIRIPDHFLCEIYITGKSKVNVSGNGECVLVCYGNEKDIETTYEGNVRVKRLNKKNRDNYE